MKNPHPVPGTPDHSTPTMKSLFTVTWPGGEKLEAELRTSYANESGPVGWTGVFHKLQERVLLSGDACALEAFLRTRAKLTGGKLKATYTGTWLAMDEVKA